jgi:hypothetical protein
MNAYVIVRSVRERTEKITYKIITGQIPGDQVEIITEVPFSKSLRTCFECAIEKNKYWTLFVDADVLLRKNAITTLVSLGERTKENVCEIHGLIVDKFLHTAKPAGARLYRTQYLKKAIEFIPTEGIDLRPEYYTLNKMREFGVLWQGTNYIVGLHDYEQYYSDIFRKFVIHSHKHFERVIELIPTFRELSKTDDDFLVALWGISAGLANGDVSTVNKDLISHEFYNRYNSIGLKEKESLAYSSAFLDYIEEELMKYLYENNNLELNENLLIRENFRANENKQDSITSNVIYSVGDILSRTGKKIKKYALK